MTAPTSSPTKKIVALVVSFVVLVVAIIGLKWLAGRSASSAPQPTAPGAALEPGQGEPSSVGPFPDMVEERQHDEAYQARLKALTDERRSEVEAASRVRSTLQTLADGLAADIRAEGKEPTPEMIEQRSAKLPEWQELETQLAAHQTQLGDIQMRTEKTIRDRMGEQYAARRTRGPAAGGAIPARVATNAIVVSDTTVTVSNRLMESQKQLPPMPERRPIGAARPVDEASE